MRGQKQQQAGASPGSKAGSKACPLVSFSTLNWESENRPRPIKTQEMLRFPSCVQIPIPALGAGSRTFKSCRPE